MIRKVIGRRRVQFGAAALCAAVVAAGVYSAWLSPGEDAGTWALAEVKRGPLVISMVESGTIQNRERAIVKSEVEGSATILYLIPEGTQVEKGELLVELDSSRLQDERLSQQITLLNAESNYIRARENLEVTRSQSESDIAKADLAFKFAQQDLNKYLEGDYPRELQRAEADITIAREELQRAADKLDWSTRLAEEGYITRTELQADELAAKRAQISLDLVEANLALLRQYSHQRSLDQLRSDVEQAELALERTKRKATADMVQVEAELKARESEFERQKARLEKVIDQIAKCRIIAPVSGMAVYATSGQGGRRGNVEPLQEGQMARERQDLIFLPTTAAMMADVKIHEANLQKVRLGMPVRITVDALPGVVFWGRVGKIGLLPDAQSAWLNPDLKVYSTDIHLEDKDGVLRPGMTCRVEIIVQELGDAVYVPVQSVVRVGGRTVAYVPASRGAPTAREVKIGLDNNSVVHVISGLTEGERVLLAPPLAPSTRSETDETDRPTDSEAVGASGPGGGASVGPGEGSVSPEPAGAAPVRGAGGGSGEAGIDGSRMREMSPEQRRQMTEQLTPEQREALRSRMGGGGGGGAGAGGGGRQ